MNDKESDYAKEGTLAHALAELILLRKAGQISTQKFSADYKKIKANELWNKEMDGHCEDYACYVMSNIGEELLVEQKLDYSMYVPEGFGTGDAVTICDNKIKVFDLKYGKGIKVEAEDNVQLKLYGIGAVEAFENLYDFEEVEVHIVQPRLGEPTTATYTVAELKEWATGIMPIAQKAWDGVQEFAAGSWCKWCKVKATCAVRLQTEVTAAFDDAYTTPEEFAGTSPTLLGPEELSYWLRVADGIIKTLKDIKDFAEDQAINHGVTYEGWKVVEGRSNRVYSDEEQLSNELIVKGIPIDTIFKPRTMVGITELEKKIGKPLFKEVVEPTLIKPPGKPTLVPHSDKREPLQSSKDVFKDE